MYKILDLLRPLEEKIQVSHVCDADLLACAVAGYRLRQFGTPPRGEFTTLAPELTAVDHEIAALIRGYYSKKLVAASLKHGHLSGFRSELAQFLTTGGRHYTNELLRLLYKLPEFYYYDTAFEGLANITAQTDFTQVETPSITVVPGLKLLRSTRGGKSFKYWCTVEGSGNLACITIDSINPLLPIWDTIYFRKEPLQLTAKCVENQVDGYHYHDIEAWRLNGNVSVD